MSERIGYVVAVVNQAAGIAEDLSSTVLHFDEACAEWERDLRMDEAREANRRDRYMVCEVIPVRDAGP